MKEKLLWRAYRNSPTLFWTVPYPTAYGLLFPRLGFATSTQIFKRYLRNGYGLQIRPVDSKGPSEQAPIKNFGEKGVWAYPRTAKSLYVGLPPIIPGTGKATNFKFCTHIRRIDRNKKPINGTSRPSRGRTQGLSKIFKTPIGLHKVHRAVIFAVAQLSCYSNYL